MTVAQADKVVAKPISLEGKAPAAKTKAKPSVEEDEEVDEPEVRKEKEAPAPKAKSNYAKVVADWDTDD